MPERRSAAVSPLFWSIAQLIEAYRSGELSPVEVAEETVSRIHGMDDALHAYLTPLDDLMRSQAKQAEADYRNGVARPLSGIPISIKDTFAVAGERTTYGSYFYRGHISETDSGLVARLRAAGAAFTGKTNTAEFGQSGTTDNRLGPDTANAWDTTRTAGGSSGGAASSVAAGLATVGLGADGGGSIRIPAAFSGLVGFKPTHGLCADENGSVAMTEFISPGPLARSVDDARRFLQVIAETDFARRSVPAGLRIAWCANPEHRPVDPRLAEVAATAAARLTELGHTLVETDLPIEGWKDIFGPLVLAVEGAERGELLDCGAEYLTGYERDTLEAARMLEPASVASATSGLTAFRRRADEFFTTCDVIVTPATATTAFPLGQRPAMIDGRPVSALWGAFPFTSPFNVAGTPAASLPCGFVDGLPVGLQIVSRRGSDHLLLDLVADIEEALSFDSSRMLQRWASPPPQHGVA